MSLPTQAAFFKGDTIVGVGFCNAGSNVTHDGLKRCIKEAMDNAWERYREDAKPIDPDKDRHANYFTTPEDLKNFDRISIYGRTVPRELALRVYFDKISDVEWKGECIFLKEGEY